MGKDDEAGTATGGGASNPVGVISLVEAFTGEKGSVSVTQFLESVDVAGCLGNWSDSQKLGIAKLKLKGTAYLFLSAHAEVKAFTKWEEFREALTLRFKKKEPLAHAEQRFRSCTQRASEGIEEFATRLLLEGQETVRKSTDEAENLFRKKVLGEALLAQFLCGLRDGIKRFVLSRNPMSFEEAITIAQLEEHNEQLVSGQESKKILFASASSPSRGAKGNGKTGPVKTASIVCFDCGKAGHVRRDCPRQKGVECFNCGKRGHIKRQCWAPEKGKGGHQKKGQRPAYRPQSGGAQAGAGAKQ